MTAKPRAAAAPQRPLRVLVIEDDHEIARGLAIRLKAAGHDPFVRHEGRSGLEAATADIPDVILLDLRLPDMNGFDVLKQLQAHPATRLLPVLVVSANIAQDAKCEAILLGADSFIEKPYEFGKLVAAIEAAARLDGAAVTS